MGVMICHLLRTGWGVNVGRGGGGGVKGVVLLWQ